MQKRVQPLAAPILVILIVSFFWLLPAAAPPAAAQDEPRSIAISPDGTRLYVPHLSVGNSTGPIWVIDATRLQYAGMVKPTGSGWPNGYIYSMAVSPDGSRLYVGHYGEVDIVDPAANRLLATVNAEPVPISMATSPDGKRLFVANNDPLPPRLDTNNPKGGLTVVDSAAAKPLTTFDLGRMTQFAAASPDGRWIYGIGCDCLGDFDTLASTLSVIDAGTLQAVHRLPLNWSISGAVLSPDGKRIYITTRYMTSHPTAGVDPRVLVYDTATNQIAATVKMDRWSYQPLVSADGKRLYLTMLNSSDTIRVLDTDSFRTIGSLSVPLNPPRGADPLAFTPDAISPDGKQLYIVNSQGDIVWAIDTASLQVKATLRLQASPTGSP